MLVSRAVTRLPRNFPLFNGFKNLTGKVPFQPSSFVSTNLCLSRSIMAESAKKKKEVVKIALVQCAVTGNKNSNLQHVGRMIEEAAKEGAKIVALPECFNSPYGVQFFAEYAERIPNGPSTDFLSHAAKEHGIYIIGGSIPELGTNGKLYNTCTVYDPNGELIGKHRKVHLFDINVPGKISFQESKVLTAGSALTMVTTDFCKIGIGICYDLRFPEMAQIYRQNGCDILFYPGAFNMTTGPAHWKILQQSRAIDNQVYVVSISPARDKSASYIAWGHSMVVNPWGKVVNEADEKESVIFADLDLSYMLEVRKQIPISTQKRNDLYDVIQPHQRKSN